MANRGRMLLGAMLLTLATGISPAHAGSLCDMEAATVFQRCKAAAKSAGLPRRARKHAIQACRLVLRVQQRSCLRGMAIFAATVWTDRPEYAPGETVTISGSGWQPGETVSMVLTEVPSFEPILLSSVADQDGNFTNTDYAPNEHDLGAAYTLNATGESSGLRAQTVFWDASVGSARVTSVVPTSGGCVLQDSLPLNSVEAWKVQQGQSYDITLSDVTDAANAGTDPTMQVLVKSSANGIQCLTATQVSTGVYTFSVTMPVDACFTYPIQYGTSGCSPSNGPLARRSDGGAKESHLSAATFGAGCAFVADDVVCDAVTTTTSTTPPTTSSTSSSTTTTTSTLPRGKLKACKYGDLNANGMNDGEPALAGWSLTISPVDDAPEGATQVTDASGCVTWTNLTPGAYAVTEAAPAGGNPWFNTDPGASGACLMVPTGCPTPSKSAGVLANLTSELSFGNLQSGELKVCKYQDLNANGAQDPGDGPLAGWSMTVTGATNGSGATPSDGCLSFFVLPIGDYSATESLQSGPPAWFNTDPGMNGAPCLPSTCPTPTKSGLTVTAGGSTTVKFGNLQSAEKHGQKFYDLNTDGLNNESQVQGVAGIKITLTGTDVKGLITPQVTYTDAQGNYAFTNLFPSCATPSCAESGYTVTETKPNASWINTTPTSIVFGLEGGEIELHNDFGNVCLGAGGGLTLGFWSNKNGQALITGADLCTLNGLNLRAANGSAFDPVAGCPAPTSTQINTGKTALKNWLLSASATNMAYMLSAQMATMEENVLRGFVSGTRMVLAGAAPAGCTVPGLNGNGFISISDLITAANSASNFNLGAFPNTTASGAARSCQEFMKTTLDKANNNLNFAQLAPCPFTTPY